jgi:cystathionine gamma-synthase
MSKKDNLSQTSNWLESTQAVHAGENRNRPYHSLIDPIVQTSTYVFDDYDDIQQFIKEQNEGLPTDRLDYGRYGNPTVRVVEERLAALEHGESALLFASGMAAVTTTLLSFLSSGDHIILTDDCYRRTREFGINFLKRFGVDSSVVPMGDYAALEAAIQKNTRFIISETPTNPYLRVLDVERVASLAKKHGIKTLVDSTFATPFNLRPLDYGIDLVVHSGTKYLSGHHDILSGVVVGSAEDITLIRDHVCTLGPVADPQNAYLLLRGLKTLALRVRHQNDSAFQVARFLENRPSINTVYYPGLESHPDHDVAVQQMHGFGGVVSFTLNANLEQTARFIDFLKIPFITPSLGGAESLVNQPSLMSYYSLSAAEREEIGIHDNLVRYAVGVEDAEDLINDLAQALDQFESK